MHIHNKPAPVTFRGNNSDTLTMEKSTMGEPYRDGIDFTYNREFKDVFLSGFFEADEAKKMRDFLNEFLDGLK